MKPLLAFLLFSCAALAQPLSQPTRFVTADPSGPCSNGSALRYNYTAGHGTLWGCKNLVWTQISGSGGGTPGGSSGAYNYNNSGAFGGGNLSQNGDGSVNASKAITAPLPYVPTYNAGGTTTCDLSQSNTCSFTTGSGNTTLAVSNPHGTGPYTLKILQGATPRTVAYPGTFVGFCPISATAAKTTTISFEYDGTNYYEKSCVSDDALDTPVIGPASSTANAIPVYSDTSGKVLGTGIIPGTGVGTALAIAKDTTGGFCTVGAGSCGAALKFSCDIPIGDTSGSALANGQLGPQIGVCFIPAAATVVEVDVRADAGTPNVIPGVRHAGSVSNLVSSALATGASGARACSKTTAVAGIDGTTCSATLQNTTIAAGDYLELVSGTAGGTAKWMTVHIVYSLN